MAIACGFLSKIFKTFFDKMYVGMMCAVFFFNYQEYPGQLGPPAAVDVGQPNVLRGHCALSFFKACICGTEVSLLLRLLYADWSVRSFSFCN